MRSIPSDDGGRIIRLVARPFIVGTLGYVPPSSRDEIFTVIELRLSEKGTGTGVVFNATRIRDDGKGDVDILNGVVDYRITAVELQ